MQFSQFANKFIIRLEKGEEIVASLTKFVEEQDIKLGTILGIGATNNVTLALYAPTEKKYYSQTLKQDFEITSLLGNITRMEEKPYLHIHISLSDHTFQAFGGHLKECIISATCEIVITQFEGEVNRMFDQEIGLNLLKFD